MATPLGECFFFGVPHSQETKKQVERKILSWILQQEGIFPEDYYFTVSFQKSPQSSAIKCDVEVRIGPVIWKGHGVSSNILSSLAYGLATAIPSPEFPAPDGYGETIHAMRAC